MFISRRSITQTYMETQNSAAFISEKVYFERNILEVRSTIPTSFAYSNLCRCLNLPYFIIIVDR